MNLLDITSVWVVAAAIFLLRIVDQSIGTMRTLSVVHGRIAAAMALGFIEILIWVTVIAQVVTNLADHPTLAVAYAGGFAVGNAAGITLERKLALGTIAVRIISGRGGEVSRFLRSHGHLVARLEGVGPEGTVTLAYVTCPRRAFPALVDGLREIDPDVFYVVERFAEASRRAPALEPTGWRAVLKKK